MSIIYLTIALIVYFIPSFISHAKPHSGGVFVVNLFLGWTFIGWVIALAWGCCGKVVE